MSINTSLSSAQFRSLLIDVPSRRIRVTNFSGTEQEQDLSEPANCGGFGRIRHFLRESTADWLPNPLPIDPAARALGLGERDSIRAQVFQSAACNWRCWYCYVPFDLLAAKTEHSEWLTAGEMIDRFLAQNDRPRMLDLSGGEPELTPEWIYWTLEELRCRGLERDLYVWSDDNLSTDYFWTKLSEAQRESIVTFRNYGRVGCFKGIDRESFCYNTNSSDEGFGMQFELMRRLIGTGIDVYAYVTFTTPNKKDICDRVKRFVDLLQDVSPNLPLRTVPLQVRVFSPVKHRLNDQHRHALMTQSEVLDAWRNEINQRFSSDLRSLSIVDVALV